MHSLLCLRRPPWFSKYLFESLFKGLFDFPFLLLFSKCILELLFNTIIEVCLPVIQGSLPCIFLERPEGQEDTELYSGVKLTLKPMWEQLGCPPFPSSLLARRYFSKWQSCTFLKGVRNDSPCRIGQRWLLMVTTNARVHSAICRSCSRVVHTCPMLGLTSCPACHIVILMRLRLLIWSCFKERSGPAAGSPSDPSPPGSRSPAVPSLAMFGSSQLKMQPSGLRKKYFWLVFLMKFESSYEDKLNLPSIFCEQLLLQGITIDHTGTLEEFRMESHHASIFSDTGHWPSSQHPWITFTLRSDCRDGNRGKLSLAFQTGSTFSKMSPLRIYCSGDFPRGPVVRTPCFRWWGPGFNPWPGN